MPIQPDTAFTLWTRPAQSRRDYVDGGRAICGEGWGAHRYYLAGEIGLALDRFTVFRFQTGIKHPTRKTQAP